MSTLTDHLQLVKPDISEGVSPSGFNRNFDKIDEAIFELENDYVVDQGEQNGWIYRRWASGIVEQWKTTDFYTVPPRSGVFTDIQLPVPMAFSNYNVQLSLTRGKNDQASFWTWINLLSCRQTVNSFTIHTFNDGTNTVTIAAHISIKGRWKE